MVRNPSRAKRAWLALPTPKMNVTGFSARKAAASPPPSTAKPRGLSRSDAILARNLLQDSPIETVMPIVRSTSAAKRASDFAGLAPCSRSVPARSRKASSIDSGSTSGVSRSIACRTSRPDARIFCHVGPNDDGGRAQPQRFEHRHGGAHAERARDVAGGGDHAAPPAADDHRTVAERWIIALLDGGVERIAVDMGDRQPRELR